MNELTINGFSALTEEEMMMIDGGGIWAGIFSAVGGALIGGLIGGVTGMVIGAISGYIIEKETSEPPIY